MGDGVVYHTSTGQYRAVATFFGTRVKLDEESIEIGLQVQKFLVVCLFWGRCHHSFLPNNSQQLSCFNLQHSFGQQFYRLTWTISTFHRYLAYKNTESKYLKKRQILWHADACDTEVCTFVCDFIEVGHGEISE